MFGAQQRAAEQGRRTLRGRKVSQRMAIVDESTRQQAVQARLDALENDNDAGEAAGDSDDEEFQVGSEDEDDDGLPAKKGKKGRKAAGTKRKLKGLAGDRRGPKSFSRLLEESVLDPQSSTGPNYLSSAAGPATGGAPRKFCSVCGNISMYTCTRCGSRFCCRKCYGVHTETRCLKFML
mmetsp:Transcript_8656/g.18379  ORF Transcript_8656/g.18379 Transcript_8656/m.18379 type:complete len:179 (-) Transcript_8656:16-552(-)|eukprot:CAMPEP_0202894514 /NCGR_PEP_ID=MMETSP1392-20130828/3907_1 /ASSEMBLY_ACC=CAM_ASM_000868 /TAXON_ID=225041 /ORGANISM="Chlamydomonas chlamydogama, Strain SAG 11-48b" /LENGTH=178 /DNA_ID=CAMNT_0049579241 /DNA_START=193 /DNA_END=729 /DNA_ORIENTATION=-